MDLSATLQQFAKADFVNGLGVGIATQSATFVYVVKRFVQVSLRHVRTVPLPESGRERLDEFDHALNVFLQDIETVPDQVVLSLPRYSAYVSRLVVPESARDVIPEVIGYQAERLLPFPKDDLYYDYLTTEVGREEKRIEVTVFGFSRREVDEYLGILLQAQLRPYMVTLSCSALASSLAFCEPQAEAPRILLVTEDSWLEMDSISGKSLVASQIVPLAQEIKKAELEELLSQAVVRNFPGASPSDTMIFSCAAPATLPITVSADRDLQMLTAARFTLTEGDVLPPLALPALGAALQAVGESVGVNLLPEERRARREKHVSPFTFILLGVLGVLSLVWATVSVLQQHRMLRNLARQRAVLEEPVRHVQAQEEEISELQQRIQKINEVSAQKVVPVLKSLSEVLPTAYYLNHLRYKGGDVEMSGIGSQSAADLVAHLENSPCLRDVAPKAPFTKTPLGETFTLGAKAEPCSE
ncbi:MAG: PilN domain-containing protein [Candidatus Binatia bacterium]